MMGTFKKIVTKSLVILFFGIPLQASAEVFNLPAIGDDLIGAITVATARAEDTLLDIARRHGVGYEDIVHANPDVDTWLPGEGTEVILPTRYVLPPGPREGIVLNLAEYRMYYYPEVVDGEPSVVMTYPISIGRMDWETPLGRTTIISKARNPSWYPPESIRAEHAAEGDPLPRIVPPGPENPLGDYAMRLGLPGYLIHGTNRPDGVGMRVTHGCIRMFPEDIDYLFDRVDIKTAVRIINEPVKVGWDGDDLVIEVHETLEVNEPVSGAEEEGELPPNFRNAMTVLTAQFVAATNSKAGLLNWDTAEKLLARANGIPSVAGHKRASAASSAAFE